MSIETFESISLAVLITALIGYMGFIIWDLAKRSNAGRIGTAALFFALGAGMAGFVIKTVLVEIVQI